MKKFIGAFAFMLVTFSTASVHAAPATTAEIRDYGYQWQCHPLSKYGKRCARPYTTEIKNQGRCSGRLCWLKKKY